MKHWLVRVMCIAAALWLTACGAGATNGAGSRCSGPFRAATDLSVAEGIKLLGTLTFQVDTSGGLSGTLSSGGQPNVIVVGQVSGRAVSLAADLGGGKYLFGTGTVFSSANGCPTVAGGPMAVESGSASASGAGAAKLLAPADQAIIERTGTWFYSAR